MSTVSQPSKWQAVLCDRPFILPERKRWRLHWETENGWWWWSNLTWTSYRYGYNVEQVRYGVHRDLSRMFGTSHRLMKIEAIHDNK